MRIGKQNMTLENLLGKTSGKVQPHNKLSEKILGNVREFSMDIY